MKLVEPPVARYRLSEESGKLRIEISPREHWAAVIFLSLWLVMWFWFEVQSFTKLKENGQTISFFLVLWTIGGILFMGNLLWLLLGCEIVEIDGTTLVRRVQIAGIGWRRAYHLSQIRDFRASVILAIGAKNRERRQVSVAFDYGARTVYFGESLDEAEMKLLVGAICERFPSLSSSSYRPG